MEALSVPPPSPSEREIKTLNRKWCRYSKLPPPPYEAFDFLIKSRLLFTIDSYSNSMIGKKCKLFTEEGYSLLVEGRNKTIAEVTQKLIFDSRKGKIISRATPNEIWSSGPLGLRKHDRFRYSQLPPSLFISKEQYKSILERGSTFWQGRVVEHKTHSCILQILTTQHKLPRFALEENLARGWPQHVTTRIINQAGEVYSFGFERENEVIEAVRSKGSYLQTFFTSSTVQIASPDYEESYPSWRKIETSISISPTIFDKIKAYVEEKNNEGLTFNFLGGDIETSANCMTLAREILKIAGVEKLPKRTTIYSYLWSMFPSLEHIPVIGGSLERIAQRVSCLAKKVFSFMNSWTPKPIKSIIKVVSIIPLQILWLLANVVIASSGGTKKEANAKRALFENWQELLREPFNDSHISLINWQNEQPSTQTIDSSTCVKFHGL